MFIKRGIIFLVLILLIVPAVYSQQLQCQDGTLFGNCKENSNKFCGYNINLIFNGGFEKDSNGDNVPNLFTKDSHQGSSYSNDAYVGEKSIKLTEQWASYDYQSFIPTGITLIPDIDYLFFAFIKGSCKNPRVYSSSSQSGPADNHLCRNNQCTIVPLDNGWSRLITQFSSNNIVTKQGNVIKLPNLRVECADSTPFELFVDNMYLQPIMDTEILHPELIEACQLCGSCPEDESSRLQQFVIENNLNEINSLNTERYRQAGRAKLAVVRKDLDLCEESVTCIQESLDLNCLIDPRPQGSSVLPSTFSLTQTNYDSEIYSSDCKMKIIESSRIDEGNFDSKRAITQEIAVGIDYVGGSKGNLIKSSRNLDPVSYEKARKPRFRNPRETFTDNCGIIRTRVDEGLISGIGDDQLSREIDTYPFGTVFIRNQPIPKIVEVVGEESDYRFNTDLLCGYDARWHKCNDYNTYKIFDENNIYYCSEGGSWAKL